MTKDIELLPCPWGCSGEIGHRIGRDTLRYVCMTCGAEGPFVEANAETPEAWERALAAWNRRSTDMESERPAPVAQDQLFEALEAAYLCGAAWAQDNGFNQGYLNKAAYDYADKTVSTLSAIPTETGKGEDGDPTWGYAETVGNLIAQLRTLPPDMPIHGAFHADYEGGRQAFIRGLTLSRERVNGRKIETGNTDIPYSAVLWSAPEQDPSPAANSPSIEEGEPVAFAWMNKQSGVCIFDQPSEDETEFFVPVYARPVPAVTDEVHAAIRDAETWLEALVSSANGEAPESAHEVVKTITRLKTIRAALSSKEA